MGLRCNEKGCGAPMVLRETRKYTYPNGQPRKFWGCSRWPDCKGIHGAHPDGSPLGIPADKPTRQARIEAHAVFDAAWRSRGMTRREAYVWLQELTGLDRGAAHISKFDAKTCAALVSAVALSEAVRLCAEEFAEVPA